MSKKLDKATNPALKTMFNTQKEQHTQGVQSVQDEQSLQSVQSVQEEEILQYTGVQNTQIKQSIQGAARTQPRGVGKASRINMAFTDENLEFLRLVSRIEGESITSYVNDLIEVDRIKRADELEAVKKVFKKR